MARAEHTYTAQSGTGAVAVAVIVPDGVEVPNWVEFKLGGVITRFTHTSVKSVRSPQNRRPRVENATQIPEDWTPPDAEVERLRVECPSVNFEFELAQLIDYYRGKGQPMKDWLATWRRWVRATHRRNVERGWRPRPASMSGETEKQRWLRERGLTEAEYEANKHDPEWRARIERRGRVA